MSARIDVRSKPVFPSFPDGPQHTYIVYTNEVGEQRILRGGPEGSNLEGVIIGDIEVVDKPYRQNDPENDFMDPPDWDSDGTHISQTIFTGTDEEMYALVDLMISEMNRINEAGYDYNLPLLELLVPAWADLNDQNSNTVIGHLFPT